METTRNISDSLAHSLLILRTFTSGRFDLWSLCGNDRAKQRQAIMSALTGRKVPLSQCGVTALRLEFYIALGIPRLECENSREEWFIQIADYITRERITGGAL